MGGALGVSGVEIEGLVTDTLDLSRFPVFSEDAQIVVDDAYSVPVPDTAYFRGRIAGDPESIAVLAVPETGNPRGMLLNPAGVWMIEDQPIPSGKGLKARKLKNSELAALKHFRCGTDGLDLVPESLSPNASEGSPLGAPETAAAAAAYTARIAVETDAEYYNHFGNTAAATNYAADLFAYASTIYEREIGTSMNVSYLRLWSGGTASDPWTATAGTSAALDEFVTYWRNNMASVNRTLAHMLSGKGLGGGVAYVGVLCDNRYGYGLSSSLGYNFTPGTTQTLWDTLVVTHEIGHNFNSPHTHSYCSIGGSTEPVDACVPQAYGPACNGAYGQLPTGCPGSGQGCGTIMSYCQLIGGGYANIAMTFGLVHPYGTLPERVPQRMSAHVQSQAASYPGCLALIVDGPLLTVNKSGTGSGTVTSSPTGINCGSDCSENYPQGQSVTLTAAPDAASTFTGWSDACAGSGACTLTLDAAQSVTATFSLPTLKINDVSKAEGNSGTTAYTFTVTLAPASTGTVTVRYVTANGTALAGTDYTAIPATLLTFSPGQTSKQVTVNVTGDTTQEANETFFVNLSAPSGATLFDGKGRGTLLNDEGPVLKINDVGKAEGNSGTTAYTFTVTLAPASTGTVTVTYATTNGTALAGSDYTAIPATLLTFSPGQTSNQVTVNVTGDSTQEANETFFVNLSAPSGATLFDGKGRGTLRNDDL